MATVKLPPSRQKTTKPANGNGAKPPKLAQQAMSHVTVDTLDNDTGAGPILATGRPLDCVFYRGSLALPRRLVSPG